MSMDQRRILIADDEAALRFLLSETLEDEGYDITAVGDGTEAMARLAERTYDLVILDYMMPGYTGVDICRWLRGSGGSNAGKPVLLLSAKATDKDKQRAEEAGVTRYVVKPFSPLQLIEIVGECLQ